MPLSSSLLRRAAPGGLALLAAAALLGCGRGPAAEPAPAPRTIDLSHIIREDMPHPPGAEATRLERGPDGELAAARLSGEAGTLLRVVASPGAAVRDVEGLSPRDLVLPAVVIDARDAAQDRPGYRLSAAEVLAWERRNGAIPPGAAVLLLTGWDLRWGDPAAYLAGDPPGFGPESRALLLGERGAVALGVDAPGQALATAEGFWLSLENLTSLEQLPARGATVVIGALRLQAAASSPARVIAVVP